MANRKPVGGLRARRRKVVDPMMVPHEEAEADNRVLDEIAADAGVFDEVSETDDEMGATLEEWGDETEEAAVLEEKSVRRKYAKSTESASRKRKTVKTDIKEIEKNDEDEAPKKPERVSEKEMKKQEKIDAKNAEYEKKGKNLWIDEKGRKYKIKKDGTKKRKMRGWTKILLVFLLIVLCAGGVLAFYAYNILDRTSQVFSGNPFDIIFSNVELKKDEYNRTNILVYGNAEDEPEHGGAYLTDSIIVLSVDQDKKIASMFSIPRDLYVNYTVAGDERMSCSVGYYGKINATYLCALHANDEDTDKAATYFGRKITEITGLDIHYYVGVDWTVLTTIVDTLGGIDVDVYSADERGILDYCQGDLRLPAGVSHLDGDQALRLARARNAQGGYGLPNSNFDRERNQQRIINAIKAKALNVGLLADPDKVFKLIDGLGENVKTNVTTAEAKTFLEVVSGMEGGVSSIDTQKLYSTGRIGNASVVIPAGSTTENPYYYTRIRETLRAEIDADTEEYEKAKNPTSTEESEEVKE